MASHNRIEMTRDSCNALKVMGCEVILVVSNHADLEGLKEFKPLLFPNEPLGAKWQFAVSEARKLNPDLLLTCGSDDILNPNYLVNAYKILLSGFDFVGVSQWFMEDKKKNDLWKAWYIETKQFPVGSGRLYTKKLLDKLNWQIFDVKASRRLDDKGYHHASGFRRYVSEDVDKDGLEITAIKGDWSQLNPLSKFFGVKNIGIKKIEI